MEWHLGCQNIDLGIDSDLIWNWFWIVCVQDDFLAMVTGIVRISILPVDQWVIAAGAFVVGVELRHGDELFESSRCTIWSSSAFSK